MGKCKFCGKNTGLFNKGEICKSCKNHFLLNAQLATENINRLANDINKGFKNIDSYLTRMKIVLEQYELLDSAREALPNLIKANLNYEMVKSNMDDILIEFGNNKIISILSMKTEKGKARNAYLFLDDIDKAILEYKLFEKVLTKIKLDILDSIQRNNFVRPNIQNKKTKLTIHLDSKRKLEDVEEKFIEAVSSQIEKSIGKKIELNIEVRGKLFINFKINQCQIGRIDLISSHPQMQILTRDDVKWIDIITLQAAIDLIPKWIEYSKYILK